MNSDTNNVIFTTQIDSEILTARSPWSFFYTFTGIFSQTTYWHIQIMDESLTRCRLSVCSVQFRRHSRLPSAPGGTDTLYSIIAALYPRFVQKIERGGIGRPPRRSRVSRSARAAMGADLSVSSALPLRQQPSGTNRHTVRGTTCHLNLCDSSLGTYRSFRRCCGHPDPALRLGPQAGLMFRGRSAQVCLRPCRSKWAVGERAGLLQ